MIYINPIGIIIIFLSPRSSLFMETTNPGMVKRSQCAWQYSKTYSEWFEINVEADVAKNAFIDYR